MKVIMQKKSAPETVDNFLDVLDHPFKREILAVRQIILAADPRIKEGIKWNAPSFCVRDYFATLHLRTKNAVGVILYFGAKKNDISKNGVEISDPLLLLKWLAKDRAMITFCNLNDIVQKEKSFTQILRQWIGYL